MQLKGTIQTKSIDEVFEGKKVLYESANNGYLYITNINDCSPDSTEVSITNWWTNEKERFNIKVDQNELMEPFFITEDGYRYPLKWTQWGKSFKNKEINTGKIVMAEIKEADRGVKIAKMVPMQDRYDNKLNKSQKWLLKEIKDYLNHRENIETKASEKDYGELSIIGDLKKKFKKEFDV